MTFSRRLRLTTSGIGLLLLAGCSGGDTAQLQLPMCTSSLSPLNDGSSAARQALLISEVNPGTFVELFNFSASDIALASTAYQLVSGNVAVPMTTAGAGVTVPAGGLVALKWP